jgi:uncharacterized protein (TIGR03435 family)
LSFLSIRSNLSARPIVSEFALVARQTADLYIPFIFQIHNSRIGDTEMNRGLRVGICATHKWLVKKNLFIFLLFFAYSCIATNGIAEVIQTSNASKISGQWQGVLKTPDGQLRIVIKISSETEKLKANFYSIDQRSPAIPASALKCDGSILKMMLAPLNGSYEGRISADGNSISGTLSGGGQTTPLNLERTTPATAWAIPEPPPTPRRMASTPNPEFEVATIKPSDPSRQGKGITVRGSDVITTNTTLEDLIMIAYGLHPKQIVGAPSWSESERFDITGRPNMPGQPNAEQMRIMLQKLLSDRLQFKFHRDKKELSVYALMVTKEGPNIAKSERDPNGLPGLFFRGLGNLNVTNASMEQVANVLSTILDKPVLDQTGLLEKYDFVLKWTPDQSQFLGFGGAPPPPPDPGDTLPDLFTAIQQQLGIKLSSTKAPAEVIVIESVAKPSAN